MICDLKINNIFFILINEIIKYKQVARITLYGFDDLLSGNVGSVYTEPLNSLRFRNNVNGANHPVRPACRKQALIFVTLYDKKEVIDD